MNPHKTASTVQTIHRGIEFAASESVDWSRDPAIARLFRIPTWKRTIMLGVPLLYLLQALAYLDAIASWNDWLYYHIVSRVNVLYYWLGVTSAALAYTLGGIMNIHVHHAQRKLNPKDFRMAIWLSGISSKTLFDEFSRCLRRDLWAGAGLISLMSCIQFSLYLFHSLRPAAYCLAIVFMLCIANVTCIQSGAYYGLARKFKFSLRLEFGPTSAACALYMMSVVILLPFGIGMSISFVAKYGGAMLHGVAIGGVAMLVWINLMIVRAWRSLAESNLLDLDELNSR